MHHLSLSLPDAVAWVAAYHEEIEIKFFDRLKDVPLWGKEIDDQIAEYIEHIAGWPRCNDSWNFECGRYFGSKGLEIQKTRFVPLLPKRQQNRNLHKQDVIITLVDEL
jgi:Delta6-protoilludene synthase